MSRLKPGPISEAKAKTTADSSAVLRDDNQGECKENSKKLPESDFGVGAEPIGVRRI
jgi:hypothetical protein